ncbi:phospho-acceptor domain-containing protein [Microbacterium sp. AG790]|uniref:GAF domain-containing sensor histidine kinase n=1 Tax=Microbacterium sp. AG790 TaxID=2183995 RepID=UPI000EAE5969|nr:ATP-binding protein [Microbacterium sp. AG790]RKS89978.1 phospho-acceptor domain-containing protein [Microbacterium sp. AG790]
MPITDAAARREAIADYRIVGVPAEPNLEGLARLARTLCHVGGAVINIIDDRYQYQVAAAGVEAAICDVEDSMCAVVLPDARHVWVPDASTDERFAENPFVTGARGQVRFYASSPLITPAGVAIGTLCVFDDATGSLTAQQSAALDLLAGQAVEVLELRRLTHELERSNDQLAHFTSQISHDLRNPLTALMGQIDLALAGLDDGDELRATRALGRADAAAARMNTMITELLSFARVGGAEIRRERAALGAIAEGVIADLERAQAACDARIAVRIDPDDAIVCDPALIAVLLQNLLANALKFAASTGVAPVVELAARQGPTGWVITIDDNGPGVAAHLRERVFDIMERGDAADAPGLGLGLATSRRIVTAHGGRIAIEDAALGGARLRVSLPAV